MTKKTYIFAANWKMAGDENIALKWVKQFTNEKWKKILEDEKNQVIVFPSLVYLAQIKQLIKEKNLPIKIGAQDLEALPEILYQKSVKHTGQYPAPRQLSYFAQYTLIGHSESRADKKLSLKDINQKIDLAIKYNLKPIICVADEKQLETISQYKKDLSFYIAYEPITAIGTGNAANPNEANKFCQYIKDQLPGVKAILYGGSVNPENVNLFLSKEYISGVLVGDKSADPLFFKKIIENYLLSL